MVTLANVDLFSKFFYQLICKRILYVYITKISASLRSTFAKIIIKRKVEYFFETQWSIKLMAGIGPFKVIQCRQNW